MKKKYIVKLASIEPTIESDLIDEMIENMRKTINFETLKMEEGVINKVWIEDEMIFAEVEFGE